MSNSAKTIGMNIKGIRQMSAATPAGLILALILAGCVSEPQYAPDPTPVIIQPAVPVENEPEQPAAVTLGIEPEQIILGQEIDTESPWELAIRADQSPTDIATELRLTAIDGFLEIQEFTSAETQANYLVDAYLDVVQKVKFDIQRGRIAQGMGQNLLATQYLQPLRSNPTLDHTARALVLETLAESQLGLNRRVDALVSLLQRDSLLDPEQQLNNQLRIIGLLRTLSSLEQSLLRQTAINNGFPANLVGGWLGFSQIAYMPENEQQGSLFGWHNSFPSHPARDQLLGSKMTIALDQFNHVALLLPFTSPFGNAAQAFYDGFIDAHSKDTSVYKPAISLHDIGEDPSLVSLYYQSAINEGADFVVGPLGRGAVKSLLSEQPPRLPTLVLADVDPGNTAPNLYGISLSPELEAIQVAERAFADGHRQAAIFRSATPWGTRAANAFSKTWGSLGGTLVSNNSIPDTIDDYSRIIQKLLEVNTSVSRQRVLSAQLGVNLKFTPRRRDDIDLLFLAANVQQARLLVPQLRFFQAHNLPIYATSNIFSGSVNPAVDADLDKLIFGDMRWMLDIRYQQSEDEQLEQSDAISADPPDSAEQPEQEVAESDATKTVFDSKQPESLVKPKPQLIAKSAYSFSALDRLYALGMESYHLIPRLSVLRKDGWQRYNGQAFQASIRNDGNILRHLDWATFENGHVTLLEQVANENQNPVQ